MKKCKLTTKTILIFVFLFTFFFNDSLSYSSVSKEVDLDCLIKTADCIGIIKKTDHDSEYKFLRILKDKLKKCDLSNPIQIPKDKLRYCSYQFQQNPLLVFLNYDSNMELKFTNREVCGIPIVFDVHKKEGEVKTVIADAIVKNLTSDDDFLIGVGVNMTYKLGLQEGHNFITELDSTEKKIIPSVHSYNLAVKISKCDVSVVEESLQFLNDCSENPELIEWRYFVLRSYYTFAQCPYSDYLSELIVRNDIDRDLLKILVSRSKLWAQHKDVAKLVSVLKDLDKSSQYMCLRTIALLTGWNGAPQHPDKFKKNSEKYLDSFFGWWENEKNIHSFNK